MAAQIDLLFSTPDALSPARAGSGKGYATPGASDWRWHPTSRRLGLPELSISTWFRAFPARQINDQLKAATVRASAEPAARSRCAKAGFSRERQTPEALGAQPRADIERWWPLTKEFGITAE